MVPNRLTSKPTQQGWWIMQITRSSSWQDLREAKTQRWPPWTASLLIYIAIRMPLRQLRKALTVWAIIFKTWVCKVAWLVDKRCQRGYTMVRTNHKMCYLLPMIISLAQIRIYNWLGSSTWRNHWMVDKVVQYSQRHSKRTRSSIRRSIYTPMVCMGRIVKPEKKIKDIFKKSIRAAHSPRRCSNNTTKTLEGHQSRTVDCQVQELEAIRNSKYTHTRIAIQICSQMVKELARMRERRCMPRIK